MRFSVVVPVYRVEPYLRECVDSILHQSFTDFEIILVDDGSPDRCGEICDDYAAADKRVRVIHKPNGGLVSARQAGLEIAEGEYIVPVDSDDRIFPDMLARADALLRQYHPDILSFGIEVFPEEYRREMREPVPEGYYDREAMEKDIFPHMLMTPQLTHLHYFLWAKVFRKTLLYPHQMEMPTQIMLGEDICCLLPVYLQAQSVYISHEIMAGYRMRPGSESRVFYINQFEQIVLGIRKMRALEEKAPPHVSAQIDRYAFHACLITLLQAVKAHAFDRIEEIRREMQRPEFREAVLRTDSRKMTGKTRIVHFLLKRDAVRTAYVFLAVCNKIKK